jgi:uncharacterized membrane protein HdeD (DUF308 family)
VMAIIFFYGVFIMPSGVLVVVANFEARRSKS